MLTALLAALALLSQSSADHVSQHASQRAAPEGYNFLAGVGSTREPGFWITELYVELGATGLVARRSLLIADGTREQSVMVEEADCPAVREAALMFRDLPAVTLTTPGLPVYQESLFPPPPSPHGASGWIWGQARTSDGEFADVVQRTSTGALFKLIDAIDGRVLSCVQTSAN